MRSTRLVALSLAVVSVAALAAQDAPAKARENMPQFDAEKFAVTSHSLASKHPYRTHHTSKAEVLQVLWFLNQIHQLKFRMEVSPAVLRKATVTTRDEARTVGEALGEMLAECGCEYCVLPDGTVLVRQRAADGAKAWTLDGPDSKIPQ